MAWLTGWKYRKSITLSRASGAVTNYQMKLLLGESSGASGENVDCGGLCLSNFNDIRFTNNDGYTLLDYWIESLSGTTPNQLATIWIEFDSIGTTNTTFYMYYGKSDAVSVSDGDSTFLFFDDFSTAWNSTVKWTGDTTNASVTGGILTLASGTKLLYSGKQSGDIAFRARLNLGDGDYSIAGLRDWVDADQYNIVYHNVALSNHTGWQSGVADGTYSIYSNVAAGFGSYHIYDLSRIMDSGTDTSQGWLDGTSVGTNTTKVTTSDLPAHLGSGSAVAVLADWVLIRKYIATEPVWGTWSESAEWLTGWNYRKSITLSRASGVINNYQMKLLVGETSGATGENVDCAGLCLSNFNDIRFTNSNGTTLLDYWIESITGVSPNQLATIWIEFDTIGVDATTFYMYYGNSSAISLSSGVNTFIKFENFEWGSQGSNLTFSGGSNTWTSVQGTATIDTSLYYGTGTKSARFPGAAAYPVYSIPYAPNENSSIQVRVYKETAVVNGPNIGQGNGTKRWSIWVNSSELIYYYTGSSISTGVNMTADTWQLFEFNNFNWTSGTYDIWLNGTKITTSATMETTSVYSGVLAITHADTTAANDAWYDNIIVRNWVAAEPTWGTWSGTLENVDSYTKLLIHGNRNIGLVDSATGKIITVNGGAAISSGKTVTTNGNTSIVSGRPITTYGNAQLSIAQSKFGGSAGLFDGTDDRISVPASSDFDFGTGDFTIDFWVYFTSITGYQYFFDIGSDNSHMYYYNGNWYIRNPATTTILTWANTPSTNTWIHVAIGRNGTNWFLFTDGVLRTTATSSAAYGASNLVFTVGGWGSGSTYCFKGYMDEFRVSKGILRWTTDFNVATAPYETDAYTKLLLHFNDVSTFYDHSLCRPYFGDIGYFDGTGDYLTLVDSADWFLSNVNFTIDFWINFLVLPTAGNYQRIMHQWTSANNAWIVNIINTAGVYTITFQVYDGSGLNYALNQTWNSPQINTWYHIAFVRDSLTSTKLYINGIQIGSTSTLNYTILDSGAVLCIGGASAEPSINGYLDELRISKGIARWTTNFSPPTAPYDSDSYTVLLIHFNNVSGATTFYDYSISRPYFNESIYFDGSTGYLTLADSDDWYFGTSDFTIDCWVRINSFAASMIVMSQFQDTSNRWQVGIDTDTTLYFQYATTTYYITPATGMTTNTWYHVAYVKKRGMLYGYVSGELKGAISTTTINSGNMINLSGNLAIGSRYYSSWMYYFNGQIDELRVSKGVARWIDNFTPPTSEYFVTTEITAPASKRPLCVYSGGVKELSAGDSIIIPGEYQLSCSSTTSIDLASYDVQSITLTCNTIFTLNNIVNGKHCMLVVTQDVIGGRTATFSNSIKWFQGVTPSLSIVGGITDIFTFIKSRDILYGYCSKAFQVGS